MGFFPEKHRKERQNEEKNFSRGTLRGNGYKPHGLRQGRSSREHRQQHGKRRHVNAGRNVNIPDGVTMIKDNAFINCKSLRQLSLPDSLTAISCAYWEGWDSFYGCENLIATYKGTEYTFYEIDKLYEAINGN